MISTGFTFNGIHSSAKGVVLVRKDSGLFPVVYVSGNEILEEYPSRATSPFFFHTKRQPYTFTITVASTDDDLDATKLKEIASWLFRDTYKPFISDDDPDKILYVIATNQVDFITNGLEQGYFDIEFRCQFPYAIQSATPTYDYSDGSGSATPISIDCPNNVYDYYYPEIQIELQGSETGFSLVNLSESSRTTTFTGLSVGETIYLNNEKRQIISDTGNYRYGNFNKNWFRLVQGTNLIQVDGNVIIQFNCNYPVFT